MELINSMTVASYLIQLKKEFPSLKIGKRKPWWLNLIFKAPFIKKLKWFNFTQTIGTNIWLAEDWNCYNSRHQMITLRHERIHLLQFQKYGLIGMIILYLFLFFPIGLAYFRAKFEREAFAESMKAKIEYYGITTEVQDSSRKTYLRNLTGSAYLFPWPFKKVILNWFAEDWIKAVDERNALNVAKKRSPSQR